MKYIFKIIFTFCLLSICHKSFSQNSKNVSREIQEIKLIFKYLTNENTSTSFNLTLDDTLTLPPYFTSYRKYYDEKTKFKSIDLPDFVRSKYFNLNKFDCEKLNSAMLKDTSRLFFHKSWFTKNKIMILSDSIINNDKNSYTEYIKPIIFRNYTRCFITILHGGDLESFFLKKRNNQWTFDKFYIRTAE
jgi:hypothetical protein